jgi:hypothetical protein
MERASRLTELSISRPVAAILLVILIEH